MYGYSKVWHAVPHICNTSVNQIKCMQTDLLLSVHRQKHWHFDH